MSRLMDGAFIILVYLVINVLAAFISTGAATQGQSAACDTAENVTTCESGGRESFFTSVKSVAVSGFSGAPPIVNVLWLLIGVFLLSAGVLLVVLSFIPFTGN